MRRLLALVRRDSQRIVRTKGYLVLSLVQPLAYIGLFGLVFSRQIEGIGYGTQVIPYMAFILPGLVAFQTNQQFHVQLSLTSGDRRWGVLLLASLAGLRPSEYVISQVISRALLAGIQTVLILGLGFLLLSRNFVHGVIGTRVTFAIIAWISSTCLWTCIGVMIGVRVLSEEKRDVLWSLLNLPLMFTSSVFYDVRQAPTAIALLSRANPLTHCADALRACMLGNPHDAIGEIAFLCALCVVCFIATSIVLRKSAVLGSMAG